MMEVVTTVAKASDKLSLPKKPTPTFFTGQMPFRSSNQQLQSTEGKAYIVFYNIIYSAGSIQVDFLVI